MLLRTRIDNAAISKTSNWSEIESTRYYRAAMNGAEEDICIRVKWEDSIPNPTIMHNIKKEIEKYIKHILQC